MTHRILLSAVLLLMSAAQAAAEPIVFGTTELTTSGVFTCRAAPACTSSGNSVVLGTGDNATTLTFTGVETLVPVSNHVVPVTLGTLSATSDSSTFPARTNPNVAIVNFRLRLVQSGPFADHTSFTQSYGPGGMTTLRFLLGNTHAQLNPRVEGYGAMVYSLAPFDIRIPMNGSVDLTAKVGVVPEPGTLTLVGLGLAGATAWRRRKKG
jgi:PEP-CTERM motif-containing protein